MIKGKTLRTRSGTPRPRGEDRRQREGRPKPSARRALLEPRTSSTRPGPISRRKRGQAAGSPEPEAGWPRRRELEKRSTPWRSASSDTARREKELVSRRRWPRRRRSGMRRGSGAARDAREDREHDRRGGQASAHGRHGGRGEVELPRPSSASRTRPRKKRTRRPSTPSAWPSSAMRATMWPRPRSRC